jgi:hypothetical protein
LRITLSRFERNSALAGDAIFLNERNVLILNNSIFVNNQADFDSLYACNSLSGIGGALFIQEVNQNISVAFSHFYNNRALWYGNMIGIFHVENSSLSFRSQFQSLNNFSSISDLTGIVARIELSVVKERFLEGEDFFLKAVLYDSFNSSLEMKSCFIEIVVHSLLDNVDSEGLLGPFPDELGLSELEISTLGDVIFYYIPLRIVYKKAVLEFPRVEKMYNISLYLRLNHLGGVLLSNSISLSIQLCPTGHALQAHSVLFYQCIACLAGAFLNVSEESIGQCAKCPSGRFSEKLSTFCSLCPQGKFSKEEGQADICTSCSPGTFALDLAQSECLSCKLGEYTEHSGQSSCLTCPPPTITQAVGSFSKQICVCPAGKFGVAGEGSCKPCNSWKGFRCDVNSSVPFIEKGFWRFENDPALVYECFPNSACPEIGFGLTECSAGYSGKRCGDCLPDLYRKNNECLQCPQNWISVLILCFIIISAIGTYVYALFGPNYHAKAVSPLRSIVYSFQTLGVLSRFLEHKKQSRELSGIVTALDLSNFNFEIFFSHECIVNIGFWNAFLLKILLIIFVPLIMLTIGYLLTRYSKIPKTVSARYASKYERSIAFVLILISTLYTSLLSNILSVFRCYPQGDGTFTLLSSPSLDCYDSLWFKHFALISIGILIIVSIPIFLFIILYKNRKTMLSSCFYWKYGNLTRHYKPKYYYWEVIMLLWKTLFVFLVDLTNSLEKYERTFVLITFLAVQHFVDSIAQPFEKGFISIYKFRSA